MTDTTPGITLIIPGRNAERTLPSCLEATTRMLGRDGLKKVVFVDDGSTDRTAAIAGEYPVELVRLGGLGPGGARNAGVERARTELIWFIDSDCVPEPDALRRLLPHMAAEEVAGAGGSYENAEPDSLLACIIHEEIRERHLRMDTDVDYLGSFNVLYWKELLERAGGFDESSHKAEDAELAFRLKAMGYRLRFEPESLVAHHHPTRLGSYLRTQRSHGYWATRLYLSHPARAMGNSYSSLLDHVQPIVGVALLASLALLSVPEFRLLPLSFLSVLLALQLPMTIGMLRRTVDPRMTLYLPLAAVRAVVRGIGMAVALISVPFQRQRNRRTVGKEPARPDDSPMRSS